MARYRFSWENLPQGLLRALSAQLSLQGPPAAALKDRYGARPKVAFVADTWQVLLDTWLPKDRQARTAIVEELQSRKLGAFETKTKSAADQLNYLRSCRNSTTLREVVLTELILAGEADLAPIPKSKPAPPDAPATRVDDAKPQSEDTDVSSDEAAKTSLEQFVDQTLRAVLSVSELQRDDDGDVPIRTGSSVCYVRVREFDDQPSRVILISPLVAGITKSPDLLDSLNEINMQLTLGKVVLTEDRVVLEAELLADTMSPRELQWALELISTAGDYFDSKLAARFGGTTFLSDDGADGVAV